MICVHVGWMAGSVLFSYFSKGVLERTGLSSITEGIGQGRVTENLKDTPLDGALHIEDKKTVAMVFSLLRDEGTVLSRTAECTTCNLLVFC